MKKLLLLVLFMTCGLANSQESLDDLLKRFNKESVPYISVTELAMPKTKAVILDAREPSEYEVSHIENAIPVGYDHFQMETVTEKVTDKDQMIVVYCSLGIRSETVAQKLKDEGYTNVYNLYGGIFEWKNKDFKLYDLQNKETDNVDAFSKEWSKWLKKGTKVYSRKMTSN